MAADPNTASSLPPWAINWVIELAVGIWVLLTAIIGFFTRKYMGIVDDFPSTYATIERVKDMEDRIPALVSRTELIGFMQQIKEDSDKRHDQHVEAQLRMHSENLAAGAETRKAIADLGTETRQGISAVHQRVDQIFNRGGK